MKLTTPIAIIITGVLIAGTIAFTNTEQSSSPSQIAQVNSNGTETQPTAPQKNPLENVLPVDKTDHVRGSKTPKITIIEYSDYECPFCKRFHDTMKEVVDEYGDDVAWIYRHWPIESLHPVKARREALAAECAADQQGSDGFWQFSDRFLELTPSNNRTNLEEVLPQIAGEMSFDLSEFYDCIDSEKFAGKVERNLQNAVDTGGQGTPWSIIMLPDGNKIPLNGAQPIEAVSRLIEMVLAS